jgi:hypothetical protein
MPFEGSPTEIQPAVPSHTEESHPHIQVDEQGNEMVYISEKNNAVLKNAEHINLMPLEELALLSDAERIAMRISMMVKK